MKKQKDKAALRARKKARKKASKAKADAQFEYYMNLVERDCALREEKSNDS